MASRRTASARSRVDDSRRLVAETRRILDDARLLLAMSHNSLAQHRREMDCFQRWRRLMSHAVRVKKVSGAVLISGIPSRANALYLCSRFQAEGIKTKIDTPSAAPGYLVSVYRLSVKKAKDILSRCGVESQDGKAM